MRAQARGVLSSKSSTRAFTRARIVSASKARRAKASAVSESLIVRRVVL